MVSKNKGCTTSFTENNNTNAQRYERQRGHYKSLRIPHKSVSECAMNHPISYHHLEKMVNQLEQASLTVHQLLETVKLPAHESW